MDSNTSNTNDNIKNQIKQARKENSRKIILAGEIKKETARQDMCLGITSLFRVIPKGHERKIINIEQPWLGGKMIIKSAELSAEDQDVFLAILSFALESGVPTSQILNEKLKASGVANSDTMMVSFSMSEMLRRIGRSNGSRQRKAIRESIDTLSMMIFRIENRDRKGATHLISYSYEEDRKIRVALSYRLSQCLLASGLKGGGSYRTISMVDRRSLTPGVPRLLHTFLRCWGGKQITMRQMIKHVYGATSTCPSTQSRRRKAILDAENEICAKLNWDIRGTFD